MISAEELKRVRKTFDDKKESLLTGSFKALGDINRHRIFRLVSTQPQMSASDIADALRISRSLTSQHLKIMEHAQLLKKKKVGSHKFYQLDRQNPFVRALNAAIRRFG